MKYNQLNRNKNVKIILKNKLDLNRNKLAHLIVKNNLLEFGTINGEKEKIASINVRLQHAINYRNLLSAKLFYAICAAIKIIAEKKYEEEWKEIYKNKVKALHEYFYKPQINLFKKYERIPNEVRNELLNNALLINSKKSNYDDDNRNVYYAGFLNSEIRKTTSFSIIDNSIDNPVEKGWGEEPNRDSFSRK